MFYFVHCSGIKPSFLVAEDKYWWTIQEERREYTKEGWRHRRDELSILSERLKNFLEWLLF